MLLGHSLYHISVYVLKTGGRTAPAGSDGSSSATGAGPTDEVISRLIQGISTQLTQAAFGQQANMSIADFLSSLGNEFNISQGEGKLCINVVRFLFQLKFIVLHN